MKVLVEKYSAKGDIKNIINNFGIWKWHQNLGAVNSLIDPRIFISIEKTASR